MNTELSKPRMGLVVAIIACAFVLGSRFAISDEAEEAGPRSNVSEGRSFNSQITDIRWLFSDADLILARERKGICYLNILGIPLGAMKVAGKSREIPIDAGETVETFMPKAGIMDWNGRQRQIRLIHRNGIIQSPIGARYTKEEKERALKAF